MSTDQVVRLRAVLDDLENGRIATADAAAELRKMTFPATPRKTVSQQMSDSAENNMPAMLPDGGFHEVAQAYFAGRITHQQYEILAEAAGRAMKPKEQAP